MKTILGTLALAALTATAAHADPSGFSTVTVDAPHHERAVKGAIWYPAADGGRQTVFAENPVFHGVTVLEDAPVQDGTYPVIALSHGMGGGIESLAWLASDLAERGAIVISVAHPNSTWGDFDLAKGLRHWTRVQDLSRALDMLEADPRFAGHLDASRIMAAGFSYGGWTALSMGGLRGNHAGYVAHCEQYGAASSHCDDLMSKEIRLTDVSADDWNGSYADARITHVMAIDPGPIWGLEAGDGGGLVQNVALIGLGEGEDRLLAADFDASGFAEMLPDVEIDRIIPAMHFTAMPLCKPAGEAILIEEKDDPVCTDPEGADREAIHNRIVERIVANLGLQGWWPVTR